MIEKQCTKCREIRPIGWFRMDKSRLDGYSYVCKECERPGYGEREHARHLKSLPERKCTRCGKIKTRDNFGRDKRVIGGLKTRCKTCYKEIMKQERAKYPEKIKEINRRAAAKRRDKQMAYCKAYWEKNKERLKEKSRSYRQANKAKIRMLNEGRRARELNAPGRGVTKRQWEELVYMYGGKCLYPNCSEKEITMDHIIPLARGGAHDTYNVQPLCKKHNSSKRVNTVDYRGIAEWT